MNEDPFSRSVDVASPNETPSAPTNFVVRNKARLLIIGTLILFVIAGIIYTLLPR